MNLKQYLHLISEGDSSQTWTINTDFLGEKKKKKDKTPSEEVSMSQLFTKHREKCTENHTVLMFLRQKCFIVHGVGN